MHTNSGDTIARVLRAYDLLSEALTLLDRAGERDIGATLYLPLGLLEEKFALSPPAGDSTSPRDRKNRSITDN